MSKDFADLDEERQHRWVGSRIFDDDRFCARATVGAVALGGAALAVGIAIGVSTGVIEEATWWLV